MGWVAPSMAVTDGTMDWDSVVVCAARWSHMASGDGMVYASVMAASLSWWDGYPLWWSLPTVQQLATEHPVCSAFCFRVLNMP